MASKRKRRMLNLDLVVERMRQKAEEEITEPERAIIGGCHRCSLTFEDALQLLLHVVGHYPETFFLADKPSLSPLPVVTEEVGVTSDKQSQDRVESEKMVSTIALPASVVCSLCRMPFTSQIRCNAHRLLAHGLPVVPGGRNNDNNSTTSAAPLQLPNGQKFYKCQQCNLQLPNQQQLIDHLQRHHRIAIEPTFVHTHAAGISESHPESPSPSNLVIETTPEELKLEKLSPAETPKVTTVATDTTPLLAPNKHAMSNDYLNEILSSFARRQLKTRKNRKKKRKLNVVPSSTATVRLPSRLAATKKVKLEVTERQSPAEIGKTPAIPKAPPPILQSMESNEYWRNLLDENVNTPHRPKPSHWLRNRQMSDGHT